MLGSYNGHEKQARLGVLDDLIRYMRKMELEKDEPKDALGEGLGAVADKMADEESPEEDRDKEGMEQEGEGKPEAVVEIEAGPKEEMAEHELEEGETPLDHMEEELSPFQQKMKNYFNNRDKPKIGKSMSFIMATKTPAKKSTSVMDDVRKKGKPFKR